METLEDTLKNWQVDAPGMWENDTGPKNWYAVSNDNEGIIAYFAKEKDALRFRLDMVNRDLNP